MICVRAVSLLGAGTAAPSVRETLAEELRTQTCPASRRVNPPGYGDHGHNGDAVSARTVSAGSIFAQKRLLEALFRRPFYLVNWLIRYHIRDIRTRWLTSTLLDYREQYRTALAVKVQCSLALVVLVITATIAMITAMQTVPLRTVLLTAVALASGRAATLRWFHIISERRRVAEDWQEYEQRERAQQEEHQRWKNKLDSTRPSEHEMETWLNHDKTLFLDHALQRYKLAWRDIIAHAFLQTPGNKAKRARVDRGPWRYSTYRIHLFLITYNGVREVNTELDFEHASFHGHERHDYRFDAFSSVHVTETNELKYTLELTLTNGPSRELHVKGNPDEQQPTSEAHPRSLSRMNLDTSGFTHTLHILEGIASEGKNWIHRSPDRPDS
ncbi:hypothetical protein [Parasphingorhabdus pacifica]